MGRPVKDILGQRFGSLVAVENLGLREDSRGIQRAAWRFICDCGQERIEFFDKRIKQCVVCYQRERRPMVVGERYGSRVIVKRLSDGKYPRYLIRCDCGSEVSLTSSSFRNSKQCFDCAPKGQSPKYGGAAIMGTELYGRWTSMRHRCRPITRYGVNEKSIGWHGRGIKVCEEWDRSFENFALWALMHGYEPNKGLSIDRIDNDGDYEPNNCEWVTRAENSRRARKAHRLVRLSKMICLYDEPCYGDF